LTFISTIFSFWSDIEQSDLLLQAEQADCEMIVAETIFSFIDDIVAE
jgi:hypothetical protein